MRNRLVILRETSDTLAKELCEYMGVTQSMYSMWESKKDIIPLKRMIEVACFYKTSLDYVLGLSDERKYVTNNFNINYDVISSRLLLVRKELKLSQNKFAVLIDSTRDKVAKTEYGKLYMTCDSLIKLCKLTNISADWIIGRSDDKFLK